MSELTIESGVVLGFGGTNARKAVSNQGDIEGFTSVTTPDKPRELFGWMARQVLGAAETGHTWLVAGFPGPVTADGKLIGPMANISGLSKEQYDLAEELAVADPATARLLDEGFNLIAVNDGELAAQAAALRVGDQVYKRTAALILGTGVGAGIVDQDPQHPSVYRADRTNPGEIGHILLSSNPRDTFENAVSGPALTAQFQKDPREMPGNHPAWRKVGEATAQMSVMLGLINGVDLVVPCGGVGSGASESYSSYLRDYLDTLKEYGNGTQILLTPEVKLVSSEDAQVFEMFGAEGVVRDFSTRQSSE